MDAAILKCLFTITGCGLVSFGFVAQSPAVPEWEKYSGLALGLIILGYMLSITIKDRDAYRARLEKMHDAELANQEKQTASREQLAHALDKLTEIINQRYHDK